MTINNSEFNINTHDTYLRAKLNELQEQINISKRNKEPIEKIKEIQKEYNHIKAILYLPKIRTTLSPPPPFSFSTSPPVTPPTNSSK